MKKIAMVLMLIVVTMGTAFAQNYREGDKFKWVTSIVDETYRTLRIQTKTELDIVDTGHIELVKTNAAGDPRIVTVVSVYGEAEIQRYEADLRKYHNNNKFTIKRWKVGDKLTTNDIRKDGQAISAYKIVTPNGYSVEFGCWGEKDIWTKVNNRKFGVILSSSSVLIIGDSIKIESGAIGWDDDFQAANNLDDYMEYLAKKVDYNWVKKKVDALKKSFTNAKDICPEDPQNCGCRGNINDHIIINATNGAMGWGAVWGLAPPWLMPIEFVNVQAQYTIQAYLATAIGYLYGRYPNGGDAFTRQLKLDNYILFADIAAGEHLSDTAKGMKETGATEIITKCTELIMKKIAPKGLSKIPIIGTVWGVGKGAYDGYKYAQEMGKRAVEFYNNLPEFSFEPTTGTIVKYNGKNKDVKIPTKVGNIPVELIGKNAFANNKVIESVTLDNNTTTIEDGAFSGCSSLKTVTLRAPVMVIGANAFNGCSSLTTVTIPQGAREIKFGNNVFNETSLSGAVKTRLRQFGYTGAGVGEAPCTVTFMVPYGSPVQMTAARNATVTLPTNPTKTGYTFEGWNTKADGSGTAFTASTKVTGDVTVYPKWKGVNVTVTFDINGGDGKPDPASKTVTVGEKYDKLPTNVSRSGYKFSGWLPIKAPDGKTVPIGPSTIVKETKNHTLYAQWDEIGTKVTFDPNGGSTPKNKENKETKEKGVGIGYVYGNLPTTSRSGYKFDGWFTEKNGGKKVEESTTVTGTNSHTLYAHWTIDGTLVKFDSNGGSALNPKDKERVLKYGGGGTLYGTLPTVSRSGYKFEGWFTEKNGGTKITDKTPMSNSKDHTLYAHWTK